MPHRYLSLGFEADAFGPHDAHNAVVSNGKISATVNLATGASSPVDGAYQRSRPEPETVIGGLRFRSAERTDGPWTDVIDPNGAVLASFLGEVRAAVRAGDLFVALASVPGPRWDLVACVLGASQPVLRLTGSFRTAMAAGQSLAVAAFEAGVIVFRGDRSSGLRAVAMSLPDSHASPIRREYRPDVFVADDQPWVLSGRTLCAIDPAQLSFDAPFRAVPSRFEGIAPAARGLLDPAVVAFVLANRILLDHPRVGRITLNRTPEDPPVQKGQLIAIDAVRETLPGILEVLAWRPASTAASVRPGAPSLETAAPAIAPIDPPAPTPGNATSGARHANRELLAAWADRCHFRPAPLLERILDESDRDPAFRRWLDRLGFAGLEVRTLTADWGSDPCLLAFAGIGNGDEYCLYLYPPVLTPETEPPVVEFLHETNGVLYRAQRFDDFFAAHLKTMADGQPDLVAVEKLVRERLGFVQTDVLTERAPAWIPGEWPKAVAIAEAKALEARGDLVAAERAYLTNYLASDASSREAREALDRLYAQLGWNAALANLRDADG